MDPGSAKAASSPSGGRPAPAGPARSTGLAAVCLGFLLLSGWTLPAEEPLQVFYNERPPYQVTSVTGTVSGLTADPVAYALQKAGIAFTWVPMPPARQLLKLQENHGRAAAVGWFRNPEREAFAKFSEPIYQDRQIAVLARMDNPRVARARSTGELLSDRDLTLLVKLGYSYGKELDARIARQGTRTVPVTVENLSMVQMIHARRADCMFIAPEEADSAIRLAGITAADLRLRTFPDMPQGEKRYLLFSLQMEDDSIHRINRYLAEFRASRK